MFLCCGVVCFGERLYAWASVFVGDLRVSVFVCLIRMRQSQRL